MNAVFEFMAEALARRQAGLPKHIEAVLEAATMVPKDTGDDLRIAVLVNGGRSFFLDDCEKRLRAMWPELSRQQLKRAIQFLEARAKLLRAGQRKSGKKSWIFDY